MQAETIAQSEVEQTELVFGIAGPVGADLDLVTRSLSDALRNVGYAVVTVSLSKCIDQIASDISLRTADGKQIELKDAPEEERIRSHMDAGNAIRRQTEEGAAVAHAAINEIRQARSGSGDGEPGRRAFILRSLKHEEEVFLLRRVYGPGFFLIGIHVPRHLRVELLTGRIAESHGEGQQSKNVDTYRAAANDLVGRDEKELGDEFGQRLREVFQLADVFVRMRGSSSSDPQQLSAAFERFVALILSNPFRTPTNDERLMYLAYSSSLSSGALGRQVGAVLASTSGEVQGVGWNDVPRPGGGLYQEGDNPDERDVHRTEDSSQIYSKALVVELLDYLAGQGLELPEQLREGLPSVTTLGVMSLLEFGRTTHAEMEAIVSAARVGVSARESTLYTTTFPCHECARLVVTAGVRRVVFVEPYPKSRAMELHDDAIELDPADPHSESRKVVVEPFEGVGPRRFAELFSIMPTFGNRLKRKDDEGYRLDWKGDTAQPRTPLVPLSYLELETKSTKEIERFLDKK